MAEGWPDFRMVDWPDLYPRLVLFAIGRMRRSGSGLKSGAGNRFTFTPQDCVQAAIQKSLDGSRSYDFSKSLFENFSQIISSYISNSLTSYERKHVTQDEDKILKLEDYRETPEESAIYRQSLEKFFHYLEERDLEALLVARKILLFGQVQSMELSIELELSIREIENIKKRLRRFAEKYRQDYECDPFPPKGKRKTSDGGL